MQEDVFRWLMEGDPSIRFQTLRDLKGADNSTLDKEQLLIARKGWGKRLLDLQSPEGMWGEGLYSPKWISTHYTLQTLKLLGLSPENGQGRKSCLLLLDKGFYKDGGINFFASFDHSETCVTGMVLAMLCYFKIDDDRIHKIADYLINQQMKDGGWNCESYNGAKHSSFHTTMSVLEGLSEFGKLYEEKSIRVKDHCEPAHEFLLRHHLFRSDQSGEIVDQRMTRGSFPPRWRYDIFRALDYFQSI
jgi:hypothetical protein